MVPVFVSTAVVLSTFVLSAQAKVGDLIPEFEFPSPIGHDGRTQLSDLFGGPVLIAGWRTHLVDGMHAGRFAYELSRKFGNKGLTIVMVDRNPWRGDSQYGALGFWMLFPAKPPILYSSSTKSTKSQLPIDWTVPRDDRSAVLIGVDGRVIAVGTVENVRQPEKKGDFRARLRALIKAEIGKRSNGWGSDKVAVKARKLAFGMGKLAKAMALLESSEHRSEDQVAAHREIERHLDSRCKAIRLLLAEARYGDAQQAHELLRKACQGHPGFESTAAKLAAEIAAVATKSEIKLEKALLKLLSPLIGRPAKGKAHVKILGQLRLFAKKHEGSKVADRARKLDYLAQSRICSVLGVKWDFVDEQTAKFLAKHSR